MEGGKKMLRTKKRFLLIAFAFVVLLVSLTALSSAAKKPSQFPMIATFGDDLAYRIRSDGLGPYIHKVDDVKAIIDALGDFDLDMNMAGGPAFRLLLLDFSDPASSNYNPPFISETVDAYFATQDGGLMEMDVNSSKYMRLAVNFAGYFIRFNPNTYPDTTNIKVTRTSENSWEIEATAPTDIGKLLKVKTVKGKLVLTDCGNFYLPFKVTIVFK